MTPPAVLINGEKNVFINFGIHVVHSYLGLDSLCQVFNQNNSLDCM